MKPTVTRILYLDADEKDRAQVQDILRQESADMVVTAVGTVGEFENLLRISKFDLILSEVNTPGLPDLAVLEKVKGFNPKLPVILLTGGNNGQMGAESIQRGAADLILKSPATLAILPHKVRMVMDKLQADEKWRESEQRYNDMIRRIPMGVYIARAHPGFPVNFEYISPRCCEMMGLNADEVRSNPDVVDLAAHPEDREKFRRARKEAAAAGKPFAWEGRFVVRGEQRWFRIESEPMFLPDGDILWNGVVIDITGRKQMEDQILQNEAIFTSFLENSPVYVFFKDKDIRTLRLSKNYEQMLGIPVSQAVGKSMEELFPSELSRSMDAADRRVLNEGRRVDVIEELNGRTYETTKFPILSNDQPEMLAGFTVDITERRQAERMLQQSEALNQAIISQSPIGIAVFTSTGKPLFGNQAWKKIWGISEEKYQYELSREFEALGFDEWDEYLQDHIEKVRQVYQKGGRLYLPDLKVPNPHPGAAEWVSQYYYAILDGHGQVERVVTMTEDVSARKKVEAEIMKNRALLTRVQEVAQLGSIEINLADRSVTAGPVARRIYGFNNEALSLADVQAFDLPEYRTEIDAALENLIHLNQEFNLQYKIKRKSDGAIRDIHARAEYNPEEHTVVGSIQDITERKLIMQVLMENEEKFRTLFEHANDMILISNVDDRILDANRRACDLLGYSREELLKMRVTDLQAPEVRGPEGTTLRREFEKFSDGIFESVDIRKDGTRFPVEVALSKVTSANGIRFFGIIRDVSERKRIEQELKEQIEAQKQVRDMTFDHEQTISDLKREINTLLRKAGEQEKYPVSSH